MQMGNKTFQLMHWYTKFKNSLFQPALEMALRIIEN